MRLLKICILTFTFICQFAIAKDCVILLHGLARNAASMAELETRLEQNGFWVANIDYPSRSEKIETLAELAIHSGISSCQKYAQNDPFRIHFVTHSMGGILVRYYLSKHPIENLARVVMLGPPNKGSEVVDKFKTLDFFTWLNGPAGQQLSTDKTSLVNQLGKVDFPLGIIAGNKSINWILSGILPNADDGKVTIASTKIQGMCSFLVLPVTHTFMMTNDIVETQVLSFLESGQFMHEKAKNNLCLD